MRDTRAPADKQIASGLNAAAHLSFVFKTLAMTKRARQHEFNPFRVVILILVCFFYPWVSPMAIHGLILSGSENYQS